MDRGNCTYNLSVDYVLADHAGAQPAAICVTNAADDNVTGLFRAFCARRGLPLDSNSRRRSHGIRDMPSGRLSSFEEPLCV